MASASFEDGYAQGVRDAAAWSVQSAVRVERLAIALETLAADLARQAREEVANAQTRWAENAGLRDGDKVPQPDEGSTKRRKRSDRKASTSGPTLNLEAPAIAAPQTADDLTDEQRAVRAAGMAWRA